MAVEFAIVLVPFMGLLGAVVQTGVLYFRQSQLQVVLESASRSIMTNNFSGGMNGDFVASKICTWTWTGEVAGGTLGRMFDCDKVYISIQKANVWNKDAMVNDTIPSQSNTIEVPGPDEVVVMRIFYPVSPVFSILGGSLGSFAKIEAGQKEINVDYSPLYSVYVLTATTAFRVEPNS